MILPMIRYGSIPMIKTFTLTNYTQPGHFLYPGKVFRSVVEECGKVKIVTIGIRFKLLRRWQTRRNKRHWKYHRGSILFKNIDLRLKKAFSAAQ